MEALVFLGNGKSTFEEKQKSGNINSADAIIRITKTTTCEIDLHIMDGDIP